MKTIFKLFVFFNGLLLFACEPAKDKIRKNIEEMQSTQIVFPLDEMQHCKRDSSLSDSCLWKYAKLKLVHYIDSSQCTSCYMKKIDEKYNELYRLEKDTKNQFSSIFIIEQRGNDDNYKKHISKLYSLTMYVDTMHVFAKMNLKIPQEPMYHTFLLDENNNVILVGNPLFNAEVHKVLKHIVKEKLGKSYL